VRDAVRNACRIRLRPVMMTMVSTVLGAVPLVLSTGAGAEARQALGWIVVGGLGFATIVTLFVTPVAYLLLANLSKTRSAEADRLAAELAQTSEEQWEQVPRCKPRQVAPGRSRGGWWRFGYSAAVRVFQLRLCSQAGSSAPRQPCAEVEWAWA
jgi:hypothetical protein